MAVGGGVVAPVISGRSTAKRRNSAAESPLRTFPLCARPRRYCSPFDYFFNDRTNPRTIEALSSGPLAAPLEAYAQHLHENGYAAHSGFVQLRLLGCFNRWLDRRGLASGDVGPTTI